ncbi:MAG: hypothetical protein GYB31_10285 [Bacteroidetes bacterium]|nr:hypothetical protein [Bacteroidota bacterium]
MKKSYQIANIISLVLILVLNTLANALPIGGMNTGELSDLYPNLFVPAGLTFSIWGLIYLLLTGFIVVQAEGLFQSGKTPPDFLNKIGWLFLLNGILNASWILAWHHQLVPLSLLIMLGILITLIIIYERLGRPGKENNLKEQVLVYIPFSIYLGWICIATIANVTTLLVDQNWNGFGIGEADWTIVAIILGLLVNLFFLFKRNDPFVALVGVWAFLGIYLKRNAADPQIMPIIIAAAGAALLLLILAIPKIISFFKK